MNNIEENIVWTEEKCIRLIREYKARPILWDSRGVLFYKQSVKPEEWVSIGRAINVSANDCKYKMNILMSSFRREKAKFKNSLKSGKLYRSSWFAFKELSFLINRKIDGKKRTSGDARYEDITTSRMKRVLLDHQYQLQSNKTQNAKFPDVIDIAYVQDDEYDYDIKLEAESEGETDLDSYAHHTSVPTPGPSRQKCEAAKTYSVGTSTDPFDAEELVSFTNFIQAKMKKYSEKTTIAVQRAIFDILFKADEKYYDNSNYKDLEINCLDNRPPKEIPLKRIRVSKVMATEKKDLRSAESSE